MDDLLKFNSLLIERERFGANKGEVTGRLRIEGRNGDICLNLPPSITKKLLEVSKAALIDVVEETANEFIYEITTSIPDCKSLEAPKE